MHKWRGKMWSMRSHDLIEIINLHLSEGVRDAVWSGNNLLYKVLIFSVDLKIYYGWDSMHLMDFDGCMVIS